MTITIQVSGIKATMCSIWSTINEKQPIWKQRKSLTEKYLEELLRL